jgi:hypothetical protein
MFSQELAKSWARPHFSREIMRIANPSFIEIHICFAANAVLIWLREQRTATDVARRFIPTKN